MSPCLAFLESEKQLIVFDKINKCNLFLKIYTLHTNKFDCPGNSVILFLQVDPSPGAGPQYICQVAQADEGLTGGITCLPVSLRCTEVTQHIGLGVHMWADYSLSFL